MSASNPSLTRPDLWAQLLAFDLDGAAQFSFSKRLARDNGWPAAFAQRVALEYKKFLYLAATCGHPVTPSDEVDQAWHLHLVYTRSYWDDLCGQVLKFKLHHGPTKGGAAEGHKFRDWYAQTLRAYQAAFDTAPPADIWPPAAQRFGEALYFQRLNRRRYWLVPRPRLRLRWALDRRVGLALGGALVLAGCSARLPLNPFNWYGPDFLLLFWSLCLGLVPLALWLRHRGRGAEEAIFGLPLPTYALARLANRGRSLADSALAAMAYAGHVQLLPTQKAYRLPTPPTDPYELAVWHLISPEGSALAEVRQQVQHPGFGPTQALDHRLLDNGLLLPAATRQRLDCLPLLTVLGLSTFGAIKVAVGLSRDRPVGFLLISLLALVLVGVYCQRQYGAWATGRGAALLDATSAQLRQPGNITFSTSLIALNVAVLGLNRLYTLGMSDIGDLLTPPRPISSGEGGSDGGSSDGGGSGCGGGGCGGCGGGCGGCGGCGS